MHVDLHINDRFSAKRGFDIFGKIIHHVSLRCRAKPTWVETLYFESIFCILKDDSTSPFIWLLKVALQILGQTFYKKY